MAANGLVVAASRKANLRAISRLAGAALALAAAAALGQNVGGPPPSAGSEAAPNWRVAERGILADHVQLTFDEDFFKAGEAYFSHDNQWVIYQAVAKPAEGQEPAPFYAMYVAKLNWEADRLTGAGRPILVSPPGSANTCGWFDPTDPSRIYFGSTITAPTASEAPGFQRDGSKYKWMFPTETEIITMIVPEIWHVQHPGTPLPPPSESGMRKLTHNSTYDAEASLESTGRFMVYCSLDGAPRLGDLHIMDLTTGLSNLIVGGDGYDGGPFFSPEGKRITYRSDRHGNNLLQLFVADLKFNDEGVPVGIEREHQLTDNADVNWCPFWHPGGRHLVYATSAIGHFNYEVFITTADPGNLPGSTGPERYGLQTRRVTSAGGFDGLPVFNSDGSYMMWTSQRTLDPRQKGSSQLWAARFTMELDPVAETPADPTAGH